MPIGAERHAQRAPIHQGSGMVDIIVSSLVMARHAVYSEDHHAGMAISKLGHSRDIDKPKTQEGQ